MSFQNQLFKISDFKDVLRNLFISLCESLEESRRKSISNRIEMYFRDDCIEDITCIEHMLLEVSNNITASKINTAKTNAIQLICDTYNKYSKKEDKKDKNVRKLESPILGFVKKTREYQIFEIQRQILELNTRVLDLKDERDFMISQINSKLAKISKDLDDFITTNLTLNDPVELDKTDKKMIRTVIDTTHICNTLNVELKVKNSKKKNQD
ncbi:hypothetical protein M9Y10_013723 [Tritrichomonas musculus]|uniref:Uncharacterized protein n=1 Tax=Tritrichomonas musculus TaxID=1915356 RepID=A0ABR2KXK9_9EUKA